MNGDVYRNQRRLGPFSAILLRQLDAEKPPTITLMTPSTITAIMKVNVP